ncbi:hypothetical protein [Fulvivirga sediminis]|uniref:Uncharacterized protein n=1 Tax=Fulvivirga sediminis TaxID=2803949 RepID=A0A937F359_9BACT|nr:hypothetical protein [Fulvivirga sediminis]MBL3655472.1 hypothetical protein [Fulvivirga sediminis]
MQKLRLTLITENQKSFEKATRAAELICETLGWQKGYEISKYEKFESSYRIVIKEQVQNEENSIARSIELTDRICSPWLVTFHREENNVSLIFNKSNYSRFLRNEFNVLKWAEFEIENE